LSLLAAYQKDIRLMPRPNFVFRRPDPSRVLNCPGIDQLLTATLVDRSGLGNDGTIIGATWKRLPWYLDYDGVVGRVTMGDVLDLGLNDAIIILWLKGNSTQPNQAGGYSLSGKSLGSNAVGYFFWRDRFIFHGTINVSAVGSVANWEKDDTWHMVTGIIDRSGNVSIGIDDNALVSADISGQSAVDVQSAAELHFGCVDNNVGTPDFFWKGAQVLQRIIMGSGIVNAGTDAMRISVYNRERHLFGV